MDLVQEIGNFFDLPVKEKSRFHVQIHEDNVGALGRIAFEYLQKKLMGW